MNPYDTITSPTLLLDERRARANIAWMAGRARRARARFRPHFKTHQSAEIGGWFRDEGVTAITVSSTHMAQYFADHGWQDILLAFPVNLRQMPELDALAARVQLGLLVEAPETVETLHQRLTRPVDLWIKVDSGLGRTGVHWAYFDQALRLAQQIRSVPRFTLRGLLTHAGQTYQAASPAEVIRLHAESVERMTLLRTHLRDEGLDGLEISIGDTPGCRLDPNLGGVEEIRPGNFVLYDAGMLSRGICTADEVAAAVACPVVAVHPQRNEAVIHGGAVHLSKDHYRANGTRLYGMVVLPVEQGWSAPLPDAFVRGLSQEHGILQLRGEDMSRLQVGDLAVILPAHSCLAVAHLQKYLTLTGREIRTYTLG